MRCNFPPMVSHDPGVLFSYWFIQKLQCSGAFSLVHTDNPVADIYNTRKIDPKLRSPSSNHPVQILDRGSRQFNQTYGCRDPSFSTSHIFIIIQSIHLRLLHYIMNAIIIRYKYRLLLTMTKASKTYAIHRCYS